MEKAIQRLLTESGNRYVATGIVNVSASGAEAAADENDVASPETYIGYERAENFVSPGGAVHDEPHLYTAAPSVLNDWGLSGTRTVHDEQASLNAPDGAIIYRFHARDLHLVLGPGKTGSPVHFVVTIDGNPPGENHGFDADAAGEGTVTGQRLYQLVRQTGPIADHTFEIRFLEPGAQAYAFTFG